MKSFLLFVTAFTVILTAVSVFAQDGRESRLQCDTDAYLKRTWSSVNGSKEKFDTWNQKMILSCRNMISTQKTSETKFRIPVVVHVIHEFGPENISEAQIKSQIEALNRDYNQKLTDSDVTFEFFLAKKDPQGNCTNGITRTISPYTVHGFGASNASSESELKGLISWATDRYLNIWVVRSIDQKVLGYSYVGVNPTYNWDGVVIRAKNLGQVDAIAPPYSMGRTTVHEVGHWLGLFHPFTVGYCCDDLTVSCDSCGDYVCDTPNADTVLYGCPKNINSCVDHPVDYPDALDNFMGYSDDRCMDKFTLGQVNRMKALLIAERSTIHSENNLQLTGYYGCVAGVGEEEVYSEWELYPTLTSDYLHYRFNGTAVLHKTILEITDVTGRVLLKKAVNESEIEGSVYVGDLTSGVYLWKVSSSEKIMVKKWMKL